jgi:hypothetical protein
MSQSDGADQTRLGVLAQPPGAVGDPARNGEPYGEMGLVTQPDKLAPFDWATQNGAPIDRQAGNTPGGMRDTRGDGLSGGTTNSTAVTSATVVIDIPLSQVIKLSFAYWAAALSNMFGVTLNTAVDNDPLLDLDAVINSLDINTQVLMSEYSWVIVPI